MSGVASFVWMAVFAGGGPGLRDAGGTVWGLILWAYSNSWVYETLRESSGKTVAGVERMSWRVFASRVSVEVIC